MKKDFTNVLHLYRSAVTAGHCLCGERENHAEMKCRPDIPDLPLKDAVQNQITEANKIHVYTGEKAETALILGERIEMGKAYVKYDQSAEKNSYYDIGLITTTSPTTFYTVPTSKIAPICLGAGGNELHACHITTVGWGARYSENPPGQSSHNNDYNTCTTNGVGPKPNRYKVCDLSLLELSGWKCNYNYPHPYVFRAQKCDSLIKQMHKEIERHVKNIKLPQKDLNKYINAHIYEFIETDPNNREIIKKRQECYRDDLFQNAGWCVVKGPSTSGSSSTEWGFCDTSCELVEVVLIIIF